MTLDFVFATILLGLVAAVLYYWVREWRHRRAEDRRITEYLQRMIDQ